MRRRTGNRKGVAVMEWVLAGPVLVLSLMGIIQFSLIWAGQNAVETASHFAARKFALLARNDIRKAKAAALTEASSMCVQRPGGSWGNARLTSIEFSRRGTTVDPRSAAPGDAFCLRLTHWLELSVPYANRVLYLLSPTGKTRIGERYFLLLQTARWITVE